MEIIDKEGVVVSNPHSSNKVEIQRTLLPAPITEVLGTLQRYVGICCSTPHMGVVATPHASKWCQVGPISWSAFSSQIVNQSILHHIQQDI